MKANSISLGPRARLTLLELTRESMRYPLYLAVMNTKSPEPPPGMTHDQAIGVPGAYQDEYFAYENKLRTHNNAALLGWASDINNILTFADDDISEGQLNSDREKLLSLFERYGKDYEEFTGDPIIDIGIKILAVVIGMSAMDGTPLKMIQEWLSATYRTYGATDSEKVSEAVKSEASSS